MHGSISDPGMGTCPRRVALALQTPANQQSASRVAVSTLYVAVSTGGGTLFVPCLFEL